MSSVDRQVIASKSTALTVYDYRRREAVSSCVVYCATSLAMGLAMLGVPALTAIAVPMGCHAVLTIARVFRQLRRSA